MAPPAWALEPEVASWLVPLLRERRDWVVVAHLSPDADTFGSALGLAHLLRALGHRTWVACQDDPRERFGFLPESGDLVVGGLPEGLAPGFGIATVDAADAGRLGTLAPRFGEATVVLNIDHHVSNTRFGSHNWIDVASAATGEMIARLFATFELPLAPVAPALYAAIFTDTGGFRYPATTARTLAIASALVETGFDFPALLQEIYERQSASHVKLMGLALAAMKVGGAGRLVGTAVSAAMFAESGATEQEAEGIVEVFRTIEGAELFYIMRETPAGIRVSLRAKGEHDVNRIAMGFGGGGHRQAAGCTMEGPLAAAEARLIAALDQALAAGQGA